MCHWVTLVTGEEAVPEGFLWAIQWLAVFFYADDGILASLQLPPMQAVLGVSRGPFYRFGIQTNVNKMVGMV